MKLISLATQGCRADESIFSFITEYADSTDIFCFHEILQGGAGKTERGEIKSAYEDICKLLPDHTGYFSEYGENGYWGESSAGHDFKYGIVFFARSSLEQAFVDSVRLYDPEGTWSDYSGEMAVGRASVMSVEDYAIVNVHGLWQGHIKADTEAKIEQSKRILDLAGQVGGKKIIIGDFNLRPETKSMQMICAEYRDLIQEYGIKNTRSTLYTKENRFADYAFVSSDVVVNSFAVPDVCVSDHLPLVLDFK